MITEQALQEAIAECQGTRNPNRDTCMMLAAFYTIQDHLYPPTTNDPPGYSFAESPITRYDNMASIGDYGNSDFLQTIRGKDPSIAWKVMDELMDTLKIINERLYNSTMHKIK